MSRVAAALLLAILLAGTERPLEAASGPAATPAQVSPAEVRPARVLPAAAMSPVTARVRAYREAHEVAIVRELAGLLGRPNVASDTENIEKSAAAVASLLEKRGIRPELLRVPGAPPVVYGELAAPGARRTLVLYAHYDGQPVVPAEWKGDPWSPVLRDAPVESGGRDVSLDTLRAPIPPEWRLYGRSASDDKAPVVGLLTALDALRAGGIQPAANLKFFFEGEEEAGSPHLAEVLDRYRDKLKSDLWILFDGPVHPSRRMQVFFGARGVTDVSITLYGATRRLHSGHYGNWAPNPTAQIASLIASMRDPEGRITIPGFSDAVKPLGELERRALAAAPDVDEALKEELGIGRPEGNGESLIESIQRPALNVHGITGGETGARSTNSIPTEATVAIDFRLVPDLTPESVRSAVESHIRARGFTILRENPDAAARRGNVRLAKVVWGSGYPASRTPMDLPASRAIVRVVEEAVGGSIVAQPMLGGSIPMYVFREKLGASTVGVPIANHDNNQHASNENLRIQNLWDGIELYAGILARMNW
ncbi:MAG: M20/M25/M40 family metallo-hydrolase [Acidobacteriota bacterium]